MKKNILPPEFYLHTQVEKIAPRLLGKVLFTRKHGLLTGGRIVEVEAYAQGRDQACHATNGKTNRNSVMFEKGGKAYVYTCYGLHQLFNVVTNKKNCADAILIRAIEPLVGREIMEKRRKMTWQKKEISNGPGKLTRALEIEKSDNHSLLWQNSIWIEDSGEKIKSEHILQGSRIGIDYAGDDKFLPWRFALRSPYVSFPGDLRPFKP